MTSNEAPVFSFKGKEPHRSFDGAAPVWDLKIISWDREKQNIPELQLLLHPSGKSARSSRARAPGSEKRFGCESKPKVPSFGVGYHPTIVFFKGFLDVHRGTGVLTHCHFASKVCEPHEPHSIQATAF